MRVQKPQGLALYFSILTLAMGLSFGVSAEAQSKKAAASKEPAPKASAPSTGDKKAEPQSDRLDISDVEEKYWAPKDTDFSVVQNRTYAKEKRYSVTGQIGPIVNDAYAAGMIQGIKANYFFSERYGVELMYNTSNLSDNDSIKELQKLAQGGAKPNHGKITNFYGVGFNYVPIYAKMSVLGTRIIYFDMAVTPVIGMMGYDQQTEAGNISKSSMAIGLDVTQYFFFSRHFAVRFDLANRWFNETTVKYRTDVGGSIGDKVKDGTTNITTMMLGLTYFF